MKKGQKSRIYWCWPGYEAESRHQSTDDRPVVYFRRDRLSAHDRSDLEAYAEVLRPYFDIPEGEPVFPEVDETKTGPVDQRRADKTNLAKSKPKAAGINSVNHPWRGTL